jgi:ribonuclease BN (tRNA processing enzyme)
MSEIVFVGTSDAFGAGGRRQSAVLLRLPSGGVLLDCGATTCTGLAELGIDRGEVDAIVISHFHGDHFGGIPLLLLAALYEDGRTRPLDVAGPPGTEERVRVLCRAMGHGLEDREWSFPVRFLELNAGQSRRVGPAQVESFETRHQPETSPHGLVVANGALRIAYSGDTGWFEELPRRVAGTELFICECTFHTPGFDYHLNHETLVERRSEFDCGRMILTHLGSEMADRRGRCSIETADDGLVLKI